MGGDPEASVADYDEQDYDDLAGVDLSRLDLDDIELEELGTGGFWRALGVLALLALGGMFLWLPSTSYYQRLGENSWLFFVVTGGGILVGLVLGRLLWSWAEQAARRYAERVSRRPEKPDQPPSALRRWLTLLLIIGGGSAIVVGVPAGAYYQEGDAYHSTWFLAAGGAVVIGILVGRWLLMQAAAKNARGRKELVKIEFPPWFKWVSLAVLVGLGLFALLGSILFVQKSADFEFSLGGVGFVVGVFGAIWLARRFDELEVRASKQNKARGGTLRPPPTSS